MGTSNVGDEDFCKVFRGDSLVLQGRKKGKNIYYLDGCSLNIESSKTKKKKTPKRVQFSNIVEICGDLGAISMPTVQAGLEESTRYDEG